MPPVVAAVTNALLVTFAVSTGTGLVAAYYVAQAVVYIAGQALLNSAIKALSKRPKTGEGSGLEVTVNDTAADGRIIYGEVRISGVNIIPPLTGGSDGRYLHQVIAIAIHQCSSIGSVYFWQDEITNAQIGAVSGSSTDGQVSGTKYSGKAWIRRYLGTASQTVDYILNSNWPSSFDSNFRGRGITYMALTYDWGDGKTYGSVPPVTAMVKGAIVYDPRLDTSPGANPTNASYEAWSDNPALCWADYKTSAYGFNEDPALIDWDAVVTAANICDALVNIPGSTTQKRYTLNGVLIATNDPRDNEKRILDAMMGHMTYVNGKWTCHAGAWTSAAYTIEKEDWVSISEIQTVASRDGGRWNGVRTFFVDPDRNWQRVECRPRYSDTFKSDDAGERIWLEMEQALCTNEYEAQRKGELLLRQSRNGQRLVGTLPPRFMQISTFDTVALNFDELGWDTKTFRVVSLSLNPDASVLVALVEEQSTDWTDMAAGEYNAPSGATVPTINPTSPTSPGNISATAIAGTIQVSWEAPAVIPTATEYQLYSAPTTVADPSSRRLEYQGKSLSAVIETSKSETRYWQVRAISNSYVSAFNPNTYGVAVPTNYVATAPGAGWRATVAPNYAAGYTAGTEAETSEVTVTIENGSTPVFSWTNPGSADIRIEHVGSATTSFVGSGLGNGEQRVGTFWCNIVDGGNNSSLSVEVTVVQFNFGF